MADTCFPTFCAQAEVVSFFQSVKLSPESTTPDAAYLELAKKVGIEGGVGESRRRV